MFDFLNGQLDGLETKIIDSSYNTNRIIDAFKEYIKEGYNPEDCEQEVYENLGIDPEDLTHFDKYRILEEINDFWEEYNA